MNVKILGSGCPNCKKVEEVARKVVATMGLDAEVSKVTDPLEILEYRILATPGLVVNEKIVCAGRIPSEAEVTTWLVDAEMASV